MMTPLSLHLRSAAAALALGLLTGCAQLYDPVDEAILHVRSCVQSRISWHRHRSQFKHVGYPHHFAKGFRAGYESICQGGDGCPPTLPPREYWCSFYQDDVGRAQSVEWFNGFAEGALAAQMDGRDRNAEIVTAHEATGRSCRPETVYHFDPQQSTPYSGEQPTPPEYPTPYQPWGEDSPTLGLPPVPEMPPEIYESPFIEPGTGNQREPIEDTLEEQSSPPLSPIPLPPVDEDNLPETGTEPPIPDIDFHVDTRPDGRPKGLTPAGFLSPEEESGEQLGSRINVLLKKLF